MSDSLNVNWPEVVNNLIDKTTDGIASLAGKIEQVAPKVWEIAMRQVYGEAVVTLCFIAVFLVAGIVSLTKFVKAGMAAGNQYGWEERHIVGVIVSAFFTFIPLILFVSEGRVAILTLINPEYYAALKVLEMAGLK